MPLLDHFHPPLTPGRHWESFHATWAGSLADQLNGHLLPPRYFAEEQAHAGARVEIDVATFEGPEQSSAADQGAVATATRPQVWTPPAAPLSMPGIRPDHFEVLVFHDEGGTRLVAAIELVSPGNKDRAAERRAFAVKCANYLYQGIGLVVIDIVTSRTGNLHNETLRLVEAGEPYLLDEALSLYAVAYRPAHRDDGDRIDLWPAPLALGQALPVLPLALGEELCVPVDLEAAYTDACRRRRLP